MRWFRFYDDVVYDPKIQRLPLPLLKFWMNALCLASQNNGVLPKPSDMAFILRLKEERVRQNAEDLHAAGLLDPVGDWWAPHNWSGRQYQSDSAAERVRRYRDKRQASGMDRGASYTKHLAALMERDGGKCIYCGSDDSLVIDHMIPIQNGGTDDPDNLGMACKRCNSGKAGRTPREAGYVIKSHAALDALTRYLKRSDTVTVTPQKQSRIRAESEQSRADRPPAACEIGKERKMPSKEAERIARKVAEALGGDPDSKSWHGSYVETWLVEGHSEERIMAAAERVAARDTEVKSISYLHSILKEEFPAPETSTVGILPPTGMRASKSTGEYIQWGREKYGKDFNHGHIKYSKWQFVPADWQANVIPMRKEG
jgi:5-methylcytosine-specific restriction endonuclease McrA